MINESITLPFDLPCETPPIEYVLVAAQLNPHIFDLIQKGDDLTRFHAGCIYWSYNYALGWVYKQKWDSKFKIPDWKKLRNETRQGIKALGELLKALLELCIQVHPMVNTSYINAAEWFIHVVWEMNQEEVINIELNLQSKSQLSTKHRNRLGMLQDYENPFNPSVFPHSYNLVQNASYLAEKMDQFRKLYWNPYKSAYSAWVKDLCSNPEWICSFEEKGKLLYHHKGRGTRCLYSPSPETLSQ